LGGRPQHIPKSEAELEYELFFQIREYGIWLHISTLKEYHAIRLQAI
jgi:hypothetical protein